MDTDAHGFFMGKKTTNTFQPHSIIARAASKMFQLAATLSQFACGAKVDFLFTAP
jgi:hypothetical protein